MYPGIETSVLLALCAVVRLVLETAESDENKH